MREISPAVNATVDEFMALLSDDDLELIKNVRRSKRAGLRPCPSSALIDVSELLNAETRANLLDRVAELVDENLTGRATMCIQFALLLDLALRHLGLRSRAVLGTAAYFDTQGRTLFEWGHAWVRIGGEVVDGNTDILEENFAVPETVSVRPYWGPITSVPADRRLRENRNMILPQDSDVTDIWWPELRAWIDSVLIGSAEAREGLP